MENLTEHWFDRTYENVSREHVLLLQQLRAGTEDNKAVEKQIQMLSTLQVQILKLRNFRKALADKKD